LYQYVFIEKALAIWSLKIENGPLENISSPTCLHLQLNIAALCCQTFCPRCQNNWAIVAAREKYFSWRFSCFAALTQRG